MKMTESIGEDRTQFSGIIREGRNEEGGVYVATLICYPTPPSYSCKKKKKNTALAFELRRTYEPSCGNIFS